MNYTIIAIVMNVFIYLFKHTVWTCAQFTINIEQRWYSCLRRCGSLGCQISSCGEDGFR